MIRHWLVVGATGGIGTAVARELAKRGCRLTLIDRPDSEHTLAENARDLEVRYQAEVSVAMLDVLEYDAHARVLDDAVTAGESFGVVLAHGVMWPQDELQRDSQTLRRHHEINATAPMAFLERAAERMETAGRGQIVALGSPAGDRGRRSNYLYGADKAALHCQLEGMRHRFAGTGITVTTIKPGPTRTPMTAGMDKLPLLAEPADQARRIVDGIEKRKSVVYTPPVWWPIMHAIRHLPRFIYDRLDL